MKMDGQLSDFAWLLAGVLVLTACTAPDPGAVDYGPAADPARTPNIVLVLADDQGWRDSGAYGNTDVHTPNIDRLAAEGMRFTHAFTATAMCAPTRQQLYTGLYPVHSGAYPQNSFVEAGTRSLVHYFEELGYRVGISGKRHFAPRASFPFESLNAGDGEQDPDMASVREFVNRAPPQPYLLVVASRQPHTPWNRGETRYDPGSLQVPPDLVDTPETRAALAAYYREVSDFDRELGEVLQIVAESGSADRTIVIYTSEQGAIFPGGKWTLYDNGVRTALVVRWPGVVASNSQTDAMVAYVDVVPTLVEAAGGEAPDVDGESFLGVLRGETDRHREFVFGVHTSVGICNGGEYPIRSVRSRDFKLLLNGNAGRDFSNNITALDRGGFFASWQAAGEAGDADALRKHRAYRTRPPVEFYDLRNDPLEQHNLAADPEYAADIDRLESELRAWLAGQGDGDMLATERAATQHMTLAGKLKLNLGRCSNEP